MEITTCLALIAGAFVGGYLTAVFFAWQRKVKTKKGESFRALPFLPVTIK